MQKKKFLTKAAACTVAVSIIFSGSISVSAASTLLKKGMKSDEVKSFQTSLKKLGWFTAEATGYYGDITVSSVKQLQKSYGLTPDGIAGSKTFELVNKLLSNTGEVSSRGTTVSQTTSLLKIGMEGKAVKELQVNLKALGYFNANATGYFGSITVNAVKSLQKKYGLSVDGIVGKNTFELIDRLLSKTSRGSGGSAIALTAGVQTVQNNNFMMKWFDGVENIFKVGDTAVLYDIDTGLSFKVKRTYGSNHADCEPLTAEDTRVMKKIYGGAWSWSRRAVIVSVNGYRFAASMAGMPHAGVDSKPANVNVSNRSGDYGYGVNLDTVKGNEMSGHFDVHFYLSKTHGTQKVNEDHQAMVKKAASWAEKNF